MSKAPIPPQPPGTLSRAGKRARPSPLAAVLSVLIGAIVGVLLAKPPKGEVFSTRVLISPMAICLYLWIVLSLYWSSAAKHSSATKSAESRLSRALHLVMVNGAFLLSFWPFAGWPFQTAPPFEFPRVLPPTPFLAPLGVAVQAGCLLLALWAR